MLTFLVPAKASALMLGFDPVSQEVAVGASVDVALTISGLGDGEADSLGAYDLDIAFNSAILEFDSVTFGDPILGDQLDLLGYGSISGFDDSIPGAVILFELSLDDPSTLDSLQASSFTLATLSFETLTLGTSMLDISINALADAGGRSLTADVQSGSISAVPEPSTMLLLGTGLLGVAGFRKKLRKS